MLFKAVTSPTDLPPIGTSREDSSFDMKAVVDLGKRFEMAKDVAAFANASGGTVLVGAVEDHRTGRLCMYRPLSEGDANSTVKAFSEAVIQRCSPVPFIDAKLLSKDDGFIVAVNVWAFAGQVVGVRVQADRADGFGDHAYVFPVRSGVDTNYLRSEQLPMFTLPEIRRLAIMLDSIPMIERSRIDLARNNGETWPVTLKEVDVLANTFTLHWKRTAIDMIVFALPIDIIRHIWKMSNGKWRILVPAFGLLEDGTVNL